MRACAILDRLPSLGRVCARLLSEFADWLLLSGRVSNLHVGFSLSSGLRPRAFCRERERERERERKSTISNREESRDTPLSYL